ncbi:MAG: mechanosensitive ion channel domain-containing protein [Candidatus Electrothrix sp. YB6]
MEGITQGYYSDGIYTVSPVNIEGSGLEAQKFNALYKKKYNTEPSWVATGYYQAAKFALEAISTTELQGNLKDDRSNIRDALQKAIKDSSDEYARFITVSRYNKHRLKPVWKQLQRLLDVEKSRLSEDLLKDRVFKIGEQYFASTDLVYTGIAINSIDDVDMAAGTFTMDFYLWFNSIKKFDPSQIEFSNAVTPIRFAPEDDDVPAASKKKEGLFIRPEAEEETPGPKMQEAVHVDTVEIPGEPEASSYLYRVKGKFRADFLPGERRFGRRMLGTSFRHAEWTRNYLIYIADTGGMTPIEEGGKALTRHLRDKEVLDTDSGWTIDDTLFFQDSEAQEPLTDIRYLGDRQLDPYSRFNALIWIKDYEFTLRGLISSIYARPEARYARMLTMIYGGLLLLLWYLEKRKTDDQAIYLFKVLWFLQAVIGVTALLAVQISVMQFFEDKGFDRQYLDRVMRIFDVLWWIIPAVLINLALENFIWRPVEIRTERRIPYNARLTVSFLVYLLAFFGILSFVYDQTLAGLLAASGVLAGVFGLLKLFDFSNVFSGIIINIERPFRIGDWVKIGDHEGKVMDMTWGTTRILTRSRASLAIPNKQVTDAAVENYSSPDNRYGLSLTLETIPVSDPEAVRRLLLQAALAVKEVLRDPMPFIEFKGQGDSSAIFKVCFQVRDYEKKYRYLDAVWESVWLHLNNKGLELATPCRFLYHFEGQEPEWEQPEELARR